MGRAGAPARDTNNVQKAVLQDADGVDIGDVDVATIAGVAPQMDDTDKLAVSLYGQETAAGDKAIKATAENALRVALWDQTEDEGADINNAYGEGASAAKEGLWTNSRPHLYNENTFNRMRGNTELTLLASAARTATTSSSDQTNYNNKGVVVTLDVTAIVDTPSVTLSIEAKMGSTYEALLTASAAVTAVGTHTYIVFPGVGAASADVVQVAGFPLPRTWRVTITHADADSITYSVMASLIL